MVTGFTEQEASFDVGIILQVLKVQDSQQRIRSGALVETMDFCSLRPGDLVLLQMEVRLDDVGLLFFALMSVHLLGRSPE